MTSRGRYNQAQDWDPMRDDYDTTYDAQYPDDEASGGVQLDHCKLYVTNIPLTITEEGLQVAFAAYGTLLKVHLSKDPNKRYALVTYETQSEAKLAMMKMNRTEPLRLNIHVAHKKFNQDSQPRERRYNNYESERNFRNGGSSVSSRDRKHDEFVNGINNNLDGLNGDDSLSLDQDLDPEVEIQMEQLQLDRLRIQKEEIQCKQRMLLLNRRGNKTIAQNSTGNRRILPDGRIVVRNNNDSVADQPDSTAAGDSSSLPALQRVGSRACLACGAPADAYCARCGVAPYCGARCQQRDWVLRHRAVCHNLARQNRSSGDSKESDAEPIATPSPASPLRRPRSPTAATKRESKGNTETTDRRKNFYPAGGQTSSQQAGSSGNKPSGRGANKGYRNQGLRRPAKLDNEEEEESFEPKVEPKPTAAPPKPKPEASVPKPTAPEPVASTSKMAYNSKFMQQPKKEEPEVAKSSVSPEVKKTVPPGTVSDATPGRKIVPKNYLVETLSIGDTVLLSVDTKASDCRSKANGYVCLSLHEKSEQDYQLLCVDYSVDCEAAPDCKPNPGELFSYYNPDDGAYYRARCLNSTTAAFIDSSKIVTMNSTDKCKSMTPKYEALPEFCCVLDVPNIKIGASVKCTLKSKCADGYVVKVEDAETGAALGDGQLGRWKPLVDYLVPRPVAAAVVIPDVPRPDVTNNSTVLLVEASTLDRALVRPADPESMRKFDTVLQDVVQFGMKASPIKEPPQQGQVVIGKFTDGNCYRALCKRTNVKMNKYQLEYIEFGNVEVNTKETIYPCPQELDLNSKPTVVSLVKLQVNAKGLTAAATDYIENLRDSSTELILSLPDGAKSAPSGAEVCLSVAKNKESVNKKIELMCTPEWKKIEDKGGDVVEIQPLMMCDLEHLELPSGGCEMEVLDVGTLMHGAVSGYQRAPGATAALEALTKQMEEYCNSELGKKPYLPKLEELCIARFPPYPQWFRAVLCEQVGGPGGAEVRLMYVDYGNVETVPVALMRKMLPEFVRGRPALAAHLEIRGFPETPSDDMLAKALQHMKINEEGRGVLKVTRCEKMEPGFYMAEAPDLLKAMGL